MILGAYTFYDVVSGCHGGIMLYNNDAEAVRIFEVMLQNDKSMMHKRPEDYTLYQIGNFDNVNGYCESFDNPLVVLRGNAAIQRLRQRQDDINYYTNNQTDKEVEATEKKQPDQST